MRHAVGYDAPAHLCDSVFRAGGHDADVGLQRDGETDPNGVAVDRRDDGRAQLERRRIGRRCREVIGGGSERHCRGGKVGPGTECVAGSGKNNGADGIIVIALSIGPVEQGAQFGGVRVVPPRAVQG